MYFLIVDFKNGSSKTLCYSTVEERQKAKGYYLNNNAVSRVREYEMS